MISSPQRVLLGESEYQEAAASAALIRAGAAIKRRRGR